MTRLPITIAVAVCTLLIFCLTVRAQESNAAPGITIESLHGETSISYNTRKGTAEGTNGVFIDYNGSILTADTVFVDENTHEATADGSVRIQQGGQIWIGEHIRYNFDTRQMISEQPFRTGSPPLFMSGKGLHANIATNGAEHNIYNATNAIITADDVTDPDIKIRASRMRIIPGEKLQAWNAVLYAHGIPVFYFPYYERNLGPHANNFDFVPGYRSLYGPFILGSYTWYLNEELNGRFHLDYREKRGYGVGPDFNYNLGRWGEGNLRYYYTHDSDPQTNNVPGPVYEHRQRLYFSYLAQPWTNVEVRSLVRYQSDAGVDRDFFAGDYRNNPQPNTFVEADKLFPNFSIDMITQPQVDDFLQTVERLPDVRVSGFRQQICDTPLYYESESSAGYYQRLFPVTNNLFVSTNFEASRADTFHQITLPMTLFGWLNLIPRVGGRFTAYSDTSGPGATTDEEYRKVFNTGAEASFKLSRVWPNTHLALLDVDGIRHIIEPSIDYVYVPSPNVHPSQVPQFDYQLPSLEMLPIQFPEYNSIDSIDSQNVMRFGLRNQLQTKRSGQVQDLLDWQLYTDWYVRPQANEQTYSDLFSDLSFLPRSWIRLDSQTRFNLNTDQWTMLLDTVTLQPNDIWNWTVGQFYLRNDFSTSPTALGQGDNVFISAFLFRLNENWGVRAVHHYDLQAGRMEEQYYSLYRDLRSWTVALTGGILNNGSGPLDYSIAFTFSFKAHPKYGLGGDSVKPYTMLGMDSP